MQWCWQVWGTQGSHVLLCSAGVGKLCSYGWLSRRIVLLPLKDLLHVPWAMAAVTFVY